VHRWHITCHLRIQWQIKNVGWRGIGVSAYCLGHERAQRSWGPEPRWRCGAMITLAWFMWHKHYNCHHLWALAYIHVPCYFPTTGHELQTVQTITENILWVSELMMTHCDSLLISCPQKYSYLLTVLSSNNRAQWTPLTRSTRYVILAMCTSAKIIHTDWGRADVGCRCYRTIFRLKPRRRGLADGIAD